jgi:hypothetical protein
MTPIATTLQIVATPESGDAPFSTNLSLLGFIGTPAGVAWRVNGTLIGTGVTASYTFPISGLHSVTFEGFNTEELYQTAGRSILVGENLPPPPPTITLVVRRTDAGTAFVNTAIVKAPVAIVKPDLTPGQSFTLYKYRIGTGQYNLYEDRIQQVIRTPTNKLIYLLKLCQVGPDVYSHTWTAYAPPMDQTTGPWYDTAVGCFQVTTLNTGSIFIDTEIPPADTYTVYRPVPLGKYGAGGGFSGTTTQTLQIGNNFNPLYLYKFNMPTGTCEEKIYASFVKTNADGSKDFKILLSGEIVHGLRGPELCWQWGKSAFDEAAVDVPTITINPDKLAEESYSQVIF